LLFASSRAGRVLRSMDWTECGELACFVPASCAGPSNDPTGLKLPNSFRDLSNNKDSDCSFVMMIRPFSDKKWVVHVRLMARERLDSKSIKVFLRRDSTFTCVSDQDGSVRVTGDETLIFDIHRDSYHTVTQLYCLFTMEHRDGKSLDELINGGGPVHVHYKLPHKVPSEQDKSHVGDFFGWKSSDYVYCDGSRITKSSLVPNEN
ncbi:hypothetical protein PFISCL1PPCAC_12187, partial [Pristionchus fissidentatus]